MKSGFLHDISEAVLPPVFSMNSLRENKGLYDKVMKLAISATTLILLPLGSCNTISIKQKLRVLSLLFSFENVTKKLEIALT